jgi:uncharacterized protein (DUF1697 family)
MGTYTALLRGINVSGRKNVAMAAIRDLPEGMGLTDVRSIVQSGNLAFRSARQRGGELEHLLEAEARTRLNLGTAFFVRGAEQWRAIIAANPFPAEP